MQAELAVLDLRGVQVLGLMGRHEQLGKQDSQCEGEPEPLGVSKTHCWIVPLRGYLAACSELLSVFFLPAQ
jgi:hypothetical protein